MQIPSSTTRTAYRAFLRLRRRDWRVARLAALLLAGSVVALSHPASTAQSPTEYQVKAAYLFNFLKFVEWPEDSPVDPRGKWVIGFVGGTAIADELARLTEGKSVLGRDLEIKKFQVADNLRACNILFVGESEKKRLPVIFTALQGSSVLTVADMENFIGAGGMVQLLVEDSRVRLAIDVGATSRARLKVSSKLLSLAHVVPPTERSVNN